MIRMIVLLVCAALLLGQMHPFPGPGRATGGTAGDSSASIIETDTGGYNSGATRQWTVAGATVGDYILVFLANEEDVGLTSVADNQTNSYSELQTSTTAPFSRAYYAVVATTASTVVTVTYASTTTNYFSCLLVRGAVGIDDSDKAAGVGANISVTLTTTLNNVLLAGVYIGGQDPTAQSGFTTLHDSAYNIYSLAERYLTNIAGSNPVGVTADSHAANRFVGVAIK